MRYNGRLNHLFVNDYSEQPARHVPGTEYPVLVPRVDADGNEVAGVRSAQLQAPLGTYAGWNLRAAGYMEDEPCYLNDSYVPFARTAAERQAVGDPRPSLEERYGDQAGYAEAIAAATRRLVAEGFLLPEDAERTIAAARAQDVGLPGGAAPVAAVR